MAEQKGKYRAWDKANNQYVPKSFIDQLFLNMDGRVIRYSVFGFTDVTDKFDIEFSIGLCDKNNREIYEGATTSAGVVEWFQNRCAWVLKSFDEDGNEMFVHLVTAVASCLEITGTIHD